MSLVDWVTAVLALVAAVLSVLLPIEPYGAASAQEDSEKI